MTTDLSQDTLCECLLEGWKDEHTLRHKLLLSMKLRMDYSKSGKFRRSRLSGQKRFIELFFYSKNKTLYSLQHGNYHGCFTVVYGMGRCTLA